MPLSIMKEEVDQAKKLAIEQLDAIQNNPIVIIKKALSHLPVLLLMGAGILITWVLAVVFLISCYSTTTFFWIAISLVLLIILFPGAYLFAGRTYGQSVIIYEAYQAIIKPILGSLIAKVLNKVLKNKATATSEQVQEEFEKESGSILDKIPNFIKSRLMIFSIISDVIKIATEQYKNGNGTAVAKEKIIEFIDVQMGELANPSFRFFFKILIGNIIILAFVFS
ncbi:MAG: hypothetical protein JKY03_15180 [Aureispira sp.]|nr:hypothetical protein [Aureispira sp.]